MKIGIDAKWFYNGNPSGKVVVYNLIKALSKLETNHEFYIILFDSDKDQVFPFNNRNFRFLYVKKMPNLLANLLMPFFAKKLCLDVCIFQYFSPIASKFKKVIYIHDVIFEEHPNYFTKTELVYFRFIKLLSKHADGIITISNTEMKRIKRYGYASKKSKIDVVYNGVSNKFKPLNKQSYERIEYVRDKYRLPANYILYLGRLNSRKNIDKLLKAFSLIKDKNLNLVLAGTYDWKMFNIPKMLSDLNIEGQVILTGFISEDDIDAIYSMASLFCYLSVDEGFGLPPLEAMASGVPVLVADIDIMKEICGDSVFFVDTNDINLIAESIIQIMNMGKEKEIHITKALMRAREFTWDRSAKHLLDFIETL